MLVGFDGVRLGRLMTPELTSQWFSRRGGWGEAFSLASGTDPGRGAPESSKTVPVAFGREKPPDENRRC